uniref:Uncharacterized protein n=1 Tax=Acrobeloides nanus TaxID=290746 RepID=A0A914CQN4_9BILA
MIACNDNGNRSVLVEHNNSYSIDLAVDWIHGLVFWTDWSRINVMDLNTKQRKVLFKDIESPRAIAVDPSKGLIFWIDGIMGYHPGRRIWRASMDGNDRMTIAKSYGANCIALDIFNERVYWADERLKFIASVDYNGNDRRTIKPSNRRKKGYETESDEDMADPHSLTIFEEKLYWTDWIDVVVMNKFNGTEDRTFECTIVLFNQNFQTSVINILAAMVPYAFQKAILPWDYLIHVFVLMDTREEKNQIRVFWEYNSCFV